MVLRSLHSLLFILSFLCFSFGSLPAFAQQVSQQKQPQRAMTEKERAQYDQMNAIYAESIYMSVCMQNDQRFMTESGGIFPLDAPKEMYDKLQKACQCYVRGALKVATPSDVMSYISVIYAYRPKASQPTAEDQRYFAGDSFRRIATYTADANNRKKCGFVR